MRLILDSRLDLSWCALSYNRDITESVAQINQREASMTADAGRALVPGGRQFSDDQLRLPIERDAVIGSDLDGGYGTEQTPSDRKTITDLQKLDSLLAQRGYTHDDIDGILHDNWRRFFRRWLPV
jgi:microsomal dipeptidase-like Zn-dependent dipeptidase